MKTVILTSRCGRCFGWGFGTNLLGQPGICPQCDGNGYVEGKWDVGGDPSKPIDATLWEKERGQ